VNKEEKERGNKLLSRYLEEKTERKKNMHKQLSGGM
jgi:hypothetical protein